MTPIEAYQRDIDTRGFKSDPAQQYAVEQTQSLFNLLIEKPHPKPQKKLFGLLPSEKAMPIPGLYFWGGVGRGKSYLIDTFFDCLPFENKLRVHYSHFMQNIHSQLKVLPKTPNPLIVVAKKIAEECRILCVDEFHVDDITDAMIMAGLLDALFSEAVTLVTTSNIAPDLLYKNGLQRDRFIPAIELIKEHTNVIQLDNGIDYRLALLEKHGTFHVTTSPPEATELLKLQMKELANTTVESQQALVLHGRKVQYEEISGNQIWFEFSEICQTPRSAVDYNQIARDFETVMISNIPLMDDGKNDVVQRFIQLIDALYDRKVKFIATAFEEPHKLYTGERLAFPFQRTVSRLVEMRSEKYLAQAHISD